MDDAIRVLYIDDEPDLLLIGKRFLELSGDFSVITLDSASEALEYLKSGQTDAIISDYLMPGIDGIEFLKEVRATGNTIPFIIFTGRGREEVVIEAINNGVDFYLQKGGDPKAQFAELAHKIRQAIARRHAELLLSESEKRLADIINFLPDATFAVDEKGRVITWNRSIEEMTGIAAADILGKGDYEYAIPFYGHRRPILIDLINRPATEIDACYKNVIRGKNILIGETSLPQPRGKSRILMGKASPLYNAEGDMVGAIESIRDITEIRRSEDELRAANEQLVASEEELTSQYKTLERNERKIREREGRLKYLLGFYEMVQQPEKDLLLHAVEGAGAVTGSPLAYVAFLNDDESELAMYAWSQTSMQECTMRDKPVVYPVEKTGLWGEAVRQRRPLITNDYQAPNPLKKGYPKGHPHIMRHMNIPVMDGDHIVLVAGVANKSSDYSDNDVSELSLLMQGLWQVLKRRRTETALHANEARLRKAEKEAGLGHWEFHMESGKIVASEGAKEVYGVLDRDLSIHDAQKIPLPEYRPCLDAALKSLIDTGKPYDLEFKIRRVSDGAILDVHSRAEYDPVNKVVFGILQDITDRKRTEEALKESEQHYSRLFNLAEDSIIIVQDGIIKDLNSHFAEMLGYSFDEVINKPLQQFVHPDDLALVIDRHKRRISGEAGIPTIYSFRGVTKSGATIWVEPNTTLIDWHGRPAGLTIIRNITERNRINEDLQQAEEEYSTIFNAVSAIIWYLDKEGRVIRGNKTAADMLKIPLDQLIGKTVFDLFPREEAERFNADNRDVIESGTPKFGIIEHYTIATGEVRWAQTDKIPYRTKDGKINGVIIFVNDITERKRAEIALTESEEKFHTLFESSKDARFVVDIGPDEMPGKILDANEAAYQGLGYTREELLGKQLFDIISIDKALAGSLMKRMLTTGQVTFENEHIKKDGTTLPVEIKATILFLQGRRVMLGAAWDITDRKKAEKALWKTKEEYRTIFDAVPAIIWHVDAKGRVIHGNKAASDLLGLPLDDLIGKTVWDLFPKEEADAFFADNCEVISSREPKLDIIEQYTGADGQKRWANTDKIPDYASNGEVPGVIILVHDITDSKKANDALYQVNLKLNILSSITRHDVQNQLNILTGYLTLLEEDSGIAGKSKYFEPVKGSAQTISDLIAFTKIYEDIGVKSPQWQNVHDVVCNAINSVNLQQVSFSLDIDDIRIYADPLLERVFFNLIENSKKHGGNVTSIRFSHDKSGETLTLLYEDDGSGFDRRTKQHLFERGYGKNTGYGLFLAREILSITGITINETSEPGKGARFEIMVPKGEWRLTGNEDNCG